MKRSWIGLFLLLVLFAGGLAATWAMEEIHEPIAEKLEDASEQALKDNWVAAAWLAADAHKSWEMWSGFRACFADHGPTEEIEALFGELEIYSTTRETAAFSALCRGLARKIEAIGEAHGLMMENVL